VQRGRRRLGALRLPLLSLQSGEPPPSLSSSKYGAISKGEGEGGGGGHGQGAIGRGSSVVRVFLLGCGMVMGQGGKDGEQIKMYRRLDVNY
jgi:hypothetical protein